ncbi:hypothetical protein D3C83_11970 [compost metagenome]
MVHLRIPRFFGELDRPARGRSADIVHEHVDPPVSAEARLHHGADRGAVGHVTLMCRHLAARLPDALERLFHRVQGAVDGENAGAFLREQHRRRAPVAPSRPDAACAGDDYDLVFESRTHASPFFTKAKMLHDDARFIAICRAAP